MTNETAESYKHDALGLGVHHGYILPSIDRVLGPPEGRTLFEIGFGNGSVAEHFFGRGFDVVGIEPSKQGFDLARQSYPHLAGLHQGSVYDSLAEQYGRFSVVLSLEVIEHVYAPRKFVATAFTLLEPGGCLILSTPYHGFLKNLAVVLSGNFDHHFNPLWDHGHIKFWTNRTLRTVLAEGGFEDIQFLRVGRIPPLAKSVIAVARRPLQ